MAVLSSELLVELGLHGVQRVRLLGLLSSRADAIGSRARRLAACHGEIDWSLYASMHSGRVSCLALTVVLVLGAGSGCTELRRLLGGGGDEPSTEEDAPPTRGPGSTGTVFVWSELAGAVLWIDAHSEGALDDGAQLEARVGIHTVRARRGQEDVAVEQIEVFPAESTHVRLGPPPEPSGLVTLAPDGGETGGAGVSQLQHVRSAVEQLTIPLESCDGGVGGRVELTFSLYPTEEIGSVRVRPAPLSDPPADSRAIECVGAAAELLGLSERVEGGAVQFVFYFDFVGREGAIRPEHMIGPEAVLDETGKLVPALSDSYEPHEH